MMVGWWLAGPKWMGATLSYPWFDSSLLLLSTLLWEVCQLDFGPIGLPGSQKYRRPDYPL
ncbi:unnamed protein product, partial [Arabidopsis halleri]